MLFELKEKVELTKKQNIDIKNFLFSYPALQYVPGFIETFECLQDAGSALSVLASKINASVENEVEDDKTVAIILDFNDGNKPLRFCRKELEDYVSSMRMAA